MGGLVILGRQVHVTVQGRGLPQLLVQAVYPLLDPAGLGLAEGHVVHDVGQVGHRLATATKAERRGARGGEAYGERRKG